MLSFAYAFCFGNYDSTASKIVCSKDFFNKDGPGSRYSYLYSIMFLGCKLKSDNKSKEYLPYFYNTSTGHLLSISGLHIGSLAMLVFVLVNIILYAWSVNSKMMHVPFFYFSAPVSIIVSVAYVCFIGVEVPRLRALLMLVMVAASMYAPIFRNKMLVLAVAASIILFTMPDSVYSYSFYYSFVAVLAIFISPSKKTLVMCISIYLFLMPINLHSSGVIDVSNILCNALIIPFFSVAYFPLEIFGMTTFFAGYYDVIIVMDRLSDVLVFALRYLSKVSAFIKIRTFTITLEELLMLYVLLLAMFFGFRFCKRINRRKALCIYIGVVAFCMIVWAYVVNEYGKNRITNFELKKPYNSNGSGDIILIEVDGKSVVVDTGFGGRETFRAIKDIKRRKIKDIDYMIITHSDVDHAGGVQNFLDDAGLTVKNILVSPQERLRFNSKTNFVCKRSKIFLGSNSEIEFINPPCASGDKNVNNNALSFLLKLNGVTFLFSSDVPSDHVQKNIPLDIDTKNLVYQLSHHCSRKDNSINFMHELAPLFGFCTRDSHLLKSAVDMHRLEFPVFITGVCGDIYMDVSDTWLTVGSHRCKKISLRIKDS